MLEASTSPANSTPIATTEVDCVSRPTTMLEPASSALTAIPATATRRARRIEGPAYGILEQRVVPCGAARRAAFQRCYPGRPCDEELREAVQAAALQPAPRRNAAGTSRRCRALAWRGPSTGLCRREMGHRAALDGGHRRGDRTGVQ